MKINCNNSVIAVTQVSGNVFLFNAVNGQFVTECGGLTSTPWAINFHPIDPAVLAGGDLLGCICIWRLNHVQSMDNYPVHLRHRDIVFLNWETGDFETIWRFSLSDSIARWVDFNPDGSVLFTASERHSLSRRIFSGGNRSTSHEVHHSPLPLEKLLEFLLSEDDSWFNNNNICSHCTLRLCLWAVGVHIYRRFPSSYVPGDREVEIILRSVAAIKPQCAQRVLSAIEWIGCDPDPRKVMIVDDLPAKDWLINTGLSEPYCNAKMPRYMCCSGHTLELLMIHRQLFRYSLCFECIEGFWKWAVLEGGIHWWSWTPRSWFPEPRLPYEFPLVESLPPLAVHLCYRCCRNPRQISEILRLDSREVGTNRNSYFDSDSTDLLPGFALALLPPSTISDSLRRRRELLRNRTIDDPLNVTYDDTVVMPCDRKQTSSRHLKSCARCGGIVGRFVKMESKNKEMLNFICPLLFAEELKYEEPLLLTFDFSQTISNIFRRGTNQISGSGTVRTTLKVCHWELTFHEESPAVYPPMDRHSITFGGNSLIIPHARIANDSSIRLSPTGDLLAAIIVPPGNHGCPEVISEQDSVVAVYRIEPEIMRGQCIFAIGFEPNIEPVCVNFSPSSENLILGMAHSSLTNGRLPFSPFNQMSTISHEPENLPQAFIYNLSKSSHLAMLTRNRCRRGNVTNDENALITTKQDGKMVNSRPRTALGGIENLSALKQARGTTKGFVPLQTCNSHVALARTLISLALRNYPPKIQREFTKFYNQRSEIRTRCLQENPARFLKLERDFGHMHKEMDQVTECSFDYLQNQEILSYHLAQDFMFDCKELTPRMRYILVDWMVQVHAGFNLDPDTLYMATGILDRFLQISSNSINRQTLQLVGVTALYIASKYVELFPPDVNQFASITEGAYSSLEILDYEVTILNRLSFDINIPSPILFLRRILAALEADSQMQNFARYFLELAYHEYEIVYLGGNFLATTAVCLARAVVMNQPDIEKIWDDRISYLSGYTAADAREPLRVLARAVFRQKEPSKYRNTFRKYRAADIYQRVSTMPQLESRTIRILADIY
ncbi:hypothetical protein Aperf_G00000061156 [Anoplocephala perfoliata]